MKRSLASRCWVMSVKNNNLNFTIWKVPDSRSKEETGCLPFTQSIGNFGQNVNGKTILTQLDQPEYFRDKRGVLKGGPKFLTEISK